MRKKVEFISNSLMSVLRAVFLMEIVLILSRYIRLKRLSVSVTEGPLRRMSVACRIVVATFVVVFLLLTVSSYTLKDSIGSVVFLVI